MAAGADVEGEAVRHDRTAVTAVGRQVGEAGQDVQPRQYLAIGLDVADKTLDLSHEIGIYPALKLVDASFGREDLLLIDFQFLGDVAFGIDKCLLAYPLLRDLVLEGVADLDVVAEYVVVSDFQRADARAFYLALLHLQEVVLAAPGDVAELVQFRVHAGGDDIALAELGGGVGGHRATDVAEEAAAAAQLPDHTVEFGHAAAAAKRGDRVGLLQRTPELHHFARQYLARRRTGKDALQVAHVGHQFLKLTKVPVLFHEMLHHVIAGVQLGYVKDGHREPLTEQAGAHGGTAAVDDIDQRSSLRARSRPEYLEVAERELVHPDELRAVYPGYRADIAQTGMVRLLQIDEQRPGSADAKRTGIYGKTLQ